MRLLCFLLFYFAVHNSFSNEGFVLMELRSDSTVARESVDNQVYEIVEQQAEFPGGREEMMSFVARNLKYPDIALEYGIQGTVIIEYIVEKDGSLSGFKILKDIGGGCGEEAIRVFKSMPTWKPGMQRDKEVRVKYKAPLKFKLHDGDSPIYPLDSMAIKTLPYVNNRYPGGITSLTKLVWRDVLMPDAVKNGEIRGTAIIVITLDAKGNHSNYQILRDVCIGCSKAIIERLKIMPKWNVDKTQKKPINILLPIVFDAVPSND